MNDGFLGALVVFLVYEAVAVLFFVLAGRMQRGTLPLNRYVGIRTPATMSSPEAWQVGHHAAAPQIRWTATVFAVAGLVCLVVGVLGGPDGLVGGIVLGASALVVGLVVRAAVVAGRAVRPG